MTRLDDHVVLITGAGRGQGAAEARMAAARGALVIVADVLDDEGTEVAGEIGGTYHRLDVTSAADWRGVVEAVLADHGRIDGLVNNAGIFRHEDLINSSEDEYLQVISVNQHGVYLGMKAVAPAMKAAGKGSIVNISSVAGMRGQSSIAYVGSKWAVRGMTKSAALSLAGSNVRVNSVHPGAIETDMLFDLGDKTIDRLVGAVPMGRAASADEVASTVMFLLSNDSSYVTGAELVVDGGLII